MSAGDLSVSLMEKGIQAIPLYARPAHCFWHWQHLINENLNDLKRDRMHLSSIVRIPVDFDLSRDELLKKAEILSDVLGNI